MNFLFIALAVLAIYYITCACSYLHGRDLRSKGFLIAYTTVGYTLAFTTGLEPVMAVVAGIIFSNAYWFLFRTSNQAKPELDYMDYNLWGKIVKVWQGYKLPVGVCMLVALALIVSQNLGAANLLLVAFSVASVLLPYTAARIYRVGKHGLTRGQSRARVEIANGLCAATNISTLLVLFGQA
jgi:hypothetical protein